MKESISVSFNDEDYTFVSQKGNRSEWLKNQMFLHLDDYGELPPLSQILKPTRTHPIVVYLSERQQDALKSNASLYGMDWKERAKRVCAQIVVDSQKRIVSTRKDTEGILDALRDFRSTVEPNESDLLEAIDYLVDMVQKREAKSRYKRMIPEIVQLVNRGFTLEDIVNVAQTMKEST